MIFDNSVRQRMLNALDTLPSIPRAAYLLSAMDDLEITEIAFRLGLNTRDVESQLGKALYCLVRAVDHNTTKPN